MPALMAEAHNARRVYQGREEEEEGLRHFLPAPLDLRMGGLVPLA